MTASAASCPHPLMWTQRTRRPLGRCSSPATVPISSEVVRAGRGRRTGAGPGSPRGRGISVPTSSRQGLRQGRVFAAMGWGSVAPVGPPGPRPAARERAAEKTITTQELLKLCNTPEFSTWRRDSVKKENEKRFAALESYISYRRKIAVVCFVLACYECLFFTWNGRGGVDEVLSFSFLGCMLALRVASFAYLCWSPHDRAEEFATVASTAAYLGALGALDTKRPIGYAAHVALFGLALKLVLLRSWVLVERAANNTFGKGLLTYYPPREHESSPRPTRR